jgi:hypothetical protein
MCDVAVLGIAAFFVVPEVEETPGHGCLDAIA